MPLYNSVCECTGTQEALEDKMSPHNKVLNQLRTGWIGPVLISILGVVIDYELRLWLHRRKQKKRLY